MVDELAEARLPAPTLLELGDYPKSAAALGHELLDRLERPTVIICDNDLVGISVLAAINERGLAVPDEISLMVWDDSLLCQLMTPSLSAMRRDVLSYGSESARALLDLIQGAEPQVLLHSVPTFIPRASTGRTAGPRNP